MNPEVKTYIEAYDAAETAFNKAHDEWSAAYRAALEVAKDNGLQLGNCCWDCAYGESVVAQSLNDYRHNLFDTRDRAQSDAWKALKGSADPLARWIAENCEDYRYEATHVLRALPASMDELDALARENGWCGAWDDLRRRAEQAGVLPDASPAEPESEVTK
jgi:hypothetical protein